MRRRLDSVIDLVADVLDGLLGGVALTFLTGALSQAIASSAMNPILWRLRACFAPGLPRPTMSSIVTLSQ